jgi:hypothetical protein
LPLKSVEAAVAVNQTKTLFRGPATAASTDLSGNDGQLMQLGTAFNVNASSLFFFSLHKRKEEKRRSIDIKRRPELH